MSGVAPEGTAGALFLADLERALQPLDDPVEIMATATRLVGEELGCDRCAYAEVEDDEDHFTMTAGHGRGLEAVTGRAAMSDFGPEPLRCMRAGEPYAVADVARDPRAAPYRAAYGQAGIAAVVCVPLRKGGRFVAALAVHHGAPRVRTPAEVELLRTVVNRCWESVARVHALRALQESEERYRALVEGASDGIWLADADGRYVEANPAACAMLGYSREEHLQLNVADLIGPQEAARQADLITRLTAGESATEVWDLRHRDGRWVPVELSMRSAGHGRLQSVGRDITSRLRAEEERELLWDRERTANRRLRLLQEATAALSAAATPAQVARIATAQFGQLLRVGQVSVRELRRGRLEALDVEGRSEAARRRCERTEVTADSPSAHVAREGTALWLGAADDWGGRWPEHRRSLVEAGYTGVAVLPLVVAGRPLGVVVAALNGEAPEQADRDGAVALAGQCAQALHRAGLLAAERTARRAAEEFGHIVTALSAAAGPADVVEVILQQARLLGADGVALVVRRGGVLEPVAEWGAHDPVPGALSDDHPLARAVATRTATWDGPLAIPLVVSDRVLGAVGLWFAGTPPRMGPERRSAVLTVAAQCALALDRARLHQAEHEVADVLQRSLLPARLPALPRLAGAARYTPAAEHAFSGGDWYDMLQLGDTTVALVVGDVVGHGPHAAAIMGQLRSVLAAQLLDGCPPAVALERLDRFASRVGGSAGSTCACLTLDWATGALRWALAGHPPVLLLGGDGARFLGCGPGDAERDGAGSVLGVRGRPPYREGTTVLEPGASVVLYTDGLVERRGEILDDGLARLREAGERLAGLGPAALVDALGAAVLDESGPADDVALLVVRAVPAPLVARLPARATSMRLLRREIAAWAELAGLPDEQVEDLELVVGEAAANSAEHAYTGSPLPEVEQEIACTLARTADGGVEAEVSDRGRWRPVPDDNGYRGHGLRVIRELGAAVAIEPGPDGTRVRFRLPAPPPAAVPMPRRPAAARAAGVAAAVRELPGRRFAVTGDLDTPGRDAVAPVLLAAVGPDPMTVDLTGLSTLSSAGIALLVELAVRVGPTLSVLVAAGSSPARVCALTGLTDSVPVSEVAAGERR